MSWDSARRTVQYRKEGAHIKRNQDRTFRTSPMRPDWHDRMWQSILQLCKEGSSLHISLAEVSIVPFRLITAARQEALCQTRSTTGHFDMNSVPAYHIHSRPATIKVTKGSIVMEFAVPNHAVKLTMYAVPDKDISFTEDDRVDSLDLGERLCINRRSWTVPIKLTLSESEQVRSDDGILVSFSPEHRLLVRSLSKLLEDGDRSKSTWLDLDPSDIKERLTGAVASQEITSEVKDRFLDLKGGGFRIDSIHLSLPSEGVRKVTIRGTRMPKDVEASSVQDNAEKV